MRKIKLFENFDSSIVKNTEDILLELEDFGFEVDIKLQSNRLIIGLAKQNSEELRVFHSVDVYKILEDCDNYLSLGEGLKLEAIHLETIERDRNIETIQSLSREKSGLISIFICYTI